HHRQHLPERDQSPRHPDLPAHESLTGRRSIESPPQGGLFYFARARISTLAERWPSGLRRTLGKRVNVNSVSRVRIPLSPPASIHAILRKESACSRSKSRGSTSRSRAPGSRCRGATSG